MHKTAGIDFGTTNSTIGYSDRTGHSQLINLYKNSTSDRTSVFYSFDDGGIPIIGQEGFDEMVLGEKGRLITSPKRFLKSEELPEIQILRNKYDLIDVISHIISNFKNQLEQEAETCIDSILVGRPVRFHDTDDYLNNLAEDRLREAFKKSGFKNIEFQYEPIGAFNAYAHEHPELQKSNNKVLVIDLGGGTSDFSIFNIDDNGLNILGNNGIYIGGDNIDQKLILSHYSQYLGKGAQQKMMNGSMIDIPSHFYNAFADKSKLIFFKEHEKLIQSLLPVLVNPQDKIALSRLTEVFKDPSIGYAFHAQVEKAKIGLTQEEKRHINFNMFKNGFQDTIHRNQLNEIIASEVKKIETAIIETLNQSGLKISDIDKVIMNGGTGFIPLVRTTVENLLGVGKILEGNTISSVGHGLTLESYERFK